MSNKTKLNSSIATGLQILQQNHILFSKVGDTVCNAALIHDFQAGLRLFNGNGFLHAGNWTVQGKKNLLALKDLIRHSIAFAAKVTFDGANVCCNQNTLDTFMEPWYMEYDNMNTTDIINVFMVSTVFAPIKLHSPLSDTDAALHIDLLRAISLIFSGVKEDLNNEDKAHYTPIFAALNKQCPQAKLVARKGGFYEFTTKEGTGIYLVNFAECSKSSIAGEYVSGFRHSPDMLYHSFSMKDILSVRSI